MADYTFFFHPHSRAQIVRWALREVGADYEPVLVNWDNRPRQLLKANPMGKLPTIIHHTKGGDRVVTETAAICHYLADAERSDLLPRDNEKADYFRWLFFVAGPAEAAVTSRGMGWEPGRKQQHRVGFGTYEKVIDALDQWLTGRDYICGSRFTMADVYIGAQIHWALMFKTVPAHNSFTAYAERLSRRDTFRNAATIDLTLFENDPDRARQLI